MYYNVLKKERRLRRGSKGMGREKRDAKKRVLLYSHEFTYTGAPASLLRIGKILKTKYDVEVWGPAEGDFLCEFTRAGIPVRIVPYAACAEKETRKAVAAFDFCIVNTVVAHIFYTFARRIIPTVWYIREAQNLLQMCAASPDQVRALRGARDILCVSEYARDFIAAHYNRRVRVLHNGAEDISGGAKGRKADGEVHFLQMGAVTERKGFSEYIEAFLRLPEGCRERARLYIAGKLPPEERGYWEPLLKMTEGEARVVWLGERKGTEQKLAAYDMADVVVVASHDESCSLVALEGAMLSKPLIVTENVGAKYLVGEENGFIVKTGDCVSLSEAMERCIRRPEALADMGRYSRKAYEKYAGMEEHAAAVLALAERYTKKNKRLVALRGRFGRLFALPARAVRCIRREGFASACKKGMGRIFGK